MNSHRQLSDIEFETKFETAELDPELFTHEAHLRLVWIHIMKYGINEALEQIPAQIKNFVEVHGAGDKFNMTLTVAAIKTVYHFMLKSEASEFTDFIQEFPRLNSSFRSLIEAHYSSRILSQKRAKAMYIEPDFLLYDL